MNVLPRLSAVVSLTVTLVLWLSPLATAPVAAAPPESFQEATESPLEAEPPQGADTEDQLVADVPPQDRTRRDDGSVRLRGVEAPIELAQREAQGADRPQETD
jgi:hypothetical protein